MIPKPQSYLIVGLLLGIIVSSLIFAQISRTATLGSNDGLQVRTLKFAHALPTSHPVHEGIVYMAERVKELSAGRMELIIFPSGQLGDETKCIEQVQMGTLAMTKTSSAPMGNFLEIMKVFSLPYLFDDSIHYWHVLEGPIGDEMLRLLEKRDDGRPSGFIGLGYFDSGSRNFYSTHPIRSPADMVGKKYRVMQDPVAMDLVQAFGGSPTPIPWGELYTALKQGVVDGAENNPPSIVSSRHSEVCKFYTPNEHTRIPDIVIMSDRVWDQLSSHEQEWLNIAMEEATKFQRKRWEDSTNDSLKQMVEEGVQILEPDLEAFRSSVSSVIERHATGDLRPMYERMRAAKP
jgi:tripartite ATP-independent transporter DctP family solute receptor